MKHPKLTILLVSIAVTGCERREPINEAPEPGKPTVYAVNYPLQYFARRIGLGAVDVRFPAPANVDPAFWVPEPATIVAFQDADLILLNGAGYARWIEHASLPSSHTPVLH